jgi:hypothetical protein
MSRLIQIPVTRAIMERYFNTTTFDVAGFAAEVQRLADERQGGPIPDDVRLQMARMICAWAGAQNIPPGPEKEKALRRFVAGTCPDCGENLCDHLLLALALSSEDMAQWFSATQFDLEGLLAEADRQARERGLEEGFPRRALPQLAEMVKGYYASVGLPPPTAKLKAMAKQLRVINNVTKH